KLSAFDKFLIGYTLIQTFDRRVCTTAWQNGVVRTIHEGNAQHFARATDHSEVWSVLSGIVVAKIERDLAATLFGWQKLDENVQPKFMRLRHNGSVDRATAR